MLKKWIKISYFCFNINKWKEGVNYLNEIRPLLPKLRNKNSELLLILGSFWSISSTSLGVSLKWIIDGIIIL